MHPALESLLRRKPLVLDGAWGTQLQARGLPVGACPDAWNLSHPDDVTSVARAYVDAGADVVLTNTFGATRLMLKRHGLDGQVVAINRAGAALSKRAAGDRAKVFASMGPCGEILMMDEVPEEEVYANFLEQAQALAEGGADGIVIETMSALDEAVLAVRAAKTTGLPVVGSMVYDAGAEMDRTMMGVTPEQQAESLEAAGADVLGANCGQGIEGFVAITRRLSAASALPIWIKANAGLPTMVDGKPVYTTSPEAFAAVVPRLVEAGATMIGGCCGTAPDFIRAVARLLKGA